MLVNGTVVPGAVFDFGIHLFHNGKLLFENGRGPFLYLPKLEGFEEAALWRKLFVHAEKRLGLPMGSIKATVLIENIFAAFEMDEILYELRHHSSGLNCGMWDYTASIVVNFRHNKACLLPDRQQCVSMRSDFLKHYMELLIRTCKRRGAPATTGMVPFVLDQLPPSLSKAAAIEKARSAKLFEALAGSDGALVYDLALVVPIQEVKRLLIVSAKSVHFGARSGQCNVEVAGSAFPRERAILRENATGAATRVRDEALGRAELTSRALLRARMVLRPRHRRCQWLRGGFSDRRDLACTALAMDPTPSPARQTEARATTSASTCRRVPNCGCKSHSLSVARDHASGDAEKRVSAEEPRRGDEPRVPCRDDARAAVVHDDVPSRTGTAYEVARAVGDLNRSRVSNSG
ncbi:Malate synthase a, partial [Globisporangium splendens]